MRIYKLNEARNKERFFNRHSKLTPEQKEELINLYSKQYIPDDIIDWNKIESYSYKELYNIVDTFITDREEKKNKKNLSRAIEGRDYIKLFEDKNSEGTEYLYLPLTWLGSKYLASDHFLPKIKVPSKVMNANDFSDNTAKNTDLSPGAKWCISLWTIPDLVIDDKPITDLNGKELRHEGKRYWLGYTSQGYYFLFYFRDYNNLEDINKKIALTLSQGSSFIEDVTLADDTRGRKNPDIKRIQDYWDEHYQEYISQIEHTRGVSKEDYPKFSEYERQKEEKARKYYNSHRKDYILRDYFTYNESTGRYDSKEDVYKGVLKYLVEDGEFTVPLGIINGDFGCSGLGLETLKNGPIEVRGDFDCSWTKLTTLEYAPQKVGGNFNCFMCQLKTLEGAPKEIGGDFFCPHNQLVSLKGAPKKVGGDFNCSINKLTTLEYAPRYVGTNFYCYRNQLTTLEYSPEEVGESFICSTNQLTTLEGAPGYIGGNFHCHINSLSNLEGAPKHVGRNFICSENNLITLKGAPDTVGGSFNCSDNDLTSLEYAPKEVEGYFNCRYNPLQSKDLSTKVKGEIYY